MPILVVLLLTAATARVGWPEPPFGLSPRESAFLTAAVVLVPVLLSAAVARWAAAAVRRDPFRRSEVAPVYGRLRRYLGFAHLAALVGVLALGWGHTVWSAVTVGTPPAGPYLAPFAELLVPAPYLIALALTWLVHFGAERELHRAISAQPFWTRAGHFGMTARPFALLVGTPIVLFASQQTFTRIYPETASHWAAQLAGVMMVPVLFALLPLAVRPVLGLVPMPPGPTRERLESLARGLGFRYRDLLLWPTRGGMANALVVGIVPQARYVVFTDRLLDGLADDELDAVFGHEVGHARRGHLPYYLLFLGLSAAVTSAGAAVAVKAAAAAGWITATGWEDWLTLPPLAVMGAYLFVVFGFLSRKCEREADLYGAAAAGVPAMVRALRRVAELNGMDPDDEPAGGGRRATPVQSLFALLRAWQHGPIPARVRFLRRVDDDPDLARRFARRAFALKAGLVLGLSAVLVGLGWWLGWEELLRLL